MITRQSTAILTALMLCSSLAGACSRLPQTPLFEGLAAHADDHARQATLTARIAAEYSVGDPEGDLPQYLASQGMQVERRAVANADNPIIGAAVARHGAILTRAAEVRWRVNAAGRLTELTVRYEADALP